MAFGRGKPWCDYFVLWECGAPCLIKTNVSEVSCRKTSVGFLISKVFSSSNGVTFSPSSTMRWGWSKDHPLGRSLSTLGGVGLRQRYVGLSSSQAEEFCRQFIAVFAEHGQWAARDPGGYFPSSQVLSPIATHGERIFSPFLQSARSHSSQHLRHAKSPLPSWRKGPRIAMVD